jgi:macrolide phosphotransferase
MSAPDFAELAAAHGIELDPDATMLRTGGADAEYFGAMARGRDGKYWVLRAPRRGDVRLSAKAEAAVLNFVRPRLGIAVPDWKVHTDKLIAYPYLPGLPAAEVDPLMGELIWRVPQDNPPDVFLDSLAATMAKLHGLDAKEALAAGVSSVSPYQSRARLKVRMDDLNSLSPVPEKLWELWLKWIGEDSFWPEHTGLVHGDLYHPHLLVDQDMKLIGLEDWADAEVTDTASDFALIFSTLGREAMEEMIRRYERAGGKTWPRMADQAEMYYWASPVRFATYAMRTGDLSHLIGVKGMVQRFASMLEDSGY